VRVARSATELGTQPRPVAVGAFDGVHVGHRSVLRALVAAGETPTVVTFEPHPRRPPLLSTLDRRLELLADAGVTDVLVLDAASDVERAVAALDVRVLVGGPAIDFEPFRRPGLDIRRVPLVELASSATIRSLVGAGAVEEAARLLGRPHEVDGVVVGGDARGAGLGFPTANVEQPPELVVPAPGIYAGAAAGHRAAVSIGVNPHFGGRTLRIEAFVLDFEGDLYGRRLVVELWRYLRPERAFGSDEGLVAAIAGDVEAARAAVRPA
jgi:riboflavin kinase / FMN adenylyltransferase